MYKLPFVLAIVFQLAILVAFYRSKKDYFWLALVFVVESYPGSLFEISDSSHVLAIMHNSPAGVLFFWLVFLAVATLKAYNKKTKSPFFLTSNIVIIFTYLIIELLLFGVAKVTFIKGLAPWLLLFVIPRLLQNMEDYERFFNLVFSFIFFVVMTQVLSMVLGRDINVLLGATMDDRSMDKNIEQSAFVLRLTAGITISLYSVFGSIILLTYKKTMLSKNYLYVILTLSMFSIFLSATRGWVFAALLLFFVFVFIVVKNPFSIIIKFLIPGILVVVMFSFVPSLEKQTTLAFERMLTIIDFAKGDATAGGTLVRVTDRAPPVMKKFYESPIFGNGFGTEAKKVSDPHVGNQNLLMHAGIIGFVIYIFFFINFILKLLSRDQQLSDRNPYKKAPLLLIGFLFSLIMIHSTSSQWFGFGFGFIRGFVFLSLLSLSNTVYWESIKLNRLYSKN